MNFYRTHGSKRSSEKTHLLNPHPDSILYAGSNTALRRKRTASGSSEAVTIITYRSHRTAMHTTKPKSQISLLKILSNPKVLVALSGTVMGASIQGLLEATLEQYLELDFGLDITTVGYSFLGLSIPYFIASPLWGHTCDHWVSPKIIQPVGQAFCILGFVLLGPVGYIPESVSFHRYRVHRPNSVKYGYSARRTHRNNELIVPIQ